MKQLIPLLILTLMFANVLASCNGKKSVEVSTSVETNAEKITTSDSNAIVPTPDSIDSISVDPEVQETALQQDPPPKPKGDCEVAFILLTNPSKTHHIFQVKGFDATNFKCWSQIEKHALQICAESATCEISYMDISNITKTTTPPHYVSAAQLKSHGIANFVYKNS